MQTIDLCFYLFQNNICPTCRQKILSREDPDPEEYDFEFESGFLTDIIREINNILYDLDADEEFLYSDSSDIMELTSSDETVLFEEQSVDTREESNAVEVKSPDVTERNVLNEQSAESGDEAQDHQNVFKRQSSSDEFEDSSADESNESCEDTVWLLQDVNRNQKNTQSSQNVQPMREGIPFNINRNHPVVTRKRRRKRQRRSLKSDESSSSSDEDFESNKKMEEKKQLINEKESREEPKRGSNNRNPDESHVGESEDGIFVFNIVEVESLVSRLLEIMNQGEDVSSPNEDEIVQSCPEEWSKESVLNHDNKVMVEKNENYDNEYDEEFSDQNSKLCLRNKDKALPESAPIPLISKEGMNINVPMTGERNINLCQRRGYKKKAVKRKISDSVSESSTDNESPIKKKSSRADWENYKDNIESTVKRKASDSDNDSSSDDDGDSCKNIEDIISELWSIVGQEEEESESEQNGGNDSNTKPKEACLENEERLKKAQNKSSTDCSG